MSLKSFFLILFSLIAQIGKYNIIFFENCFKSLKKIKSIFCDLLTPPFYFKEIFEQILGIGIGSVPIVALTAIFTGSVLALQSYVGFSRLNNIDSIPLIVVISITRELGPVLTALMLSGRISSGVASEIGSMKISDQLDAIKVMGIDHIKYLFRPRLIAMMIFMPILTLIADIVGIFGGYLISITKLKYNSAMYEKLTFDFLKTEDVLSGLYKAFCFGLIIICTGYYNGYNTGFGASSVSNTTRNSVVTSTVLILIFNYLLTYLFFI